MTKAKPLHLVALALSLALGLVAACSSTPGTTSPTATISRPAAPPAVASPSASLAGSPSPATTSTVQMTDALKFEPASLTVPRGTTVTWRNTSTIAHTVTDDPSKAATKADSELPAGAQPWDSGNLNPGQTFTHTFDVPGTYKYFCQPHESAGMLGTIIVSP